MAEEDPVAVGTPEGEGAVEARLIGRVPSKAALPTKNRAWGDCYAIADGRLCAARTRWKMWEYTAWDDFARAVFGLELDAVPELGS